MISCVFKEVVEMSKAVIIPECKKDVGGVKEGLSLSPNEKRDGAIGLFSRLLRLDTLKRSSVATKPEPHITYYGVYIPCEIKKGPDEEAIHVYENKAEALELVKRYKLARFKAFHSRQDAISFALRGAEHHDTTDGNDSSVMGEKPYPFKAPSPQDMVALRKSIEKGLAATVRDRVWDNPRYLVSSGNTPAIMQEGSRYNALHVSAKALNAEMCNLILTTVGNPAFVQTLYGLDADAECCKEFAAILVDRYLNTPDKGMNETPLHFAAKFGGEEVVDVLTSFPQCNKSAVNKFGEQAKDIICKRASNASPETVQRISNMLHERYYVPVVHSEDGSAAPAIGHAFTPRSPPDINSDPLSPRYEIRAFAGPMEAREADAFRRKWKTPPRQRLASPAFRLREMTKGLEAVGRRLNSKKARVKLLLGPMEEHEADAFRRKWKTPPRQRLASFRMRETAMGLAAVGRELAEELKVGWKEYWPFLDTFTDLRTPEGLNLLENYLKNKYETACSFAYSESCAESHHSPEEITLSRISLGNLSQHSPVKNSMLSPVSELCIAMKTCTISSDRPPHWKKTDPIRQRMCRQPSGKAMLVNGDANPPTNHSVSQLLCIERTCQVFAKRIADALAFSLTSDPEVASESLKGEAKYLQHTMYTYMDDERFKNINFALIHSRLAQLVVFMLKRHTSEADDVTDLLEFLLKLRCPNDDVFSSDDEHRAGSHRGPNRVRLAQVIECHVRCLASFISEVLTESEDIKGPSVSEGECTELWEKAAKCRCDWKIEHFERNSKKNASFRKNRSILSTSPKSDGFIRRLTFDFDIGDGKLQRNETERPVSVNSPAGDSRPTVVAVDTTKCQVVEAEPTPNRPSDHYKLWRAVRVGSSTTAYPTLSAARSSSRGCLPSPLATGYKISDDDSVASYGSDEYRTASEHSDAEDDHRMQDASDRAIVEPFIYGEAPTKMDRLVFDAVSECRVSPTQYPNVYRWRHAVALYSPAERDKWLAQPSADDSVASLASFAVSTPVGRSNRAGRTRGSPAVRCSTPCKDTRDDSRAVPLQVSNWLRVTGPNSPRSALASKNLSHNVSFGF